MKRYEYTHVTLPKADEYKARQDELNKFGSAGWRFVKDVTPTAALMEKEIEGEVAGGAMEEGERNRV